MDSALVEAAREWVVDNYLYNSRHLVRALEWLDRLAPGAREAVRLATLTHDMERAFPGPDQPITRLLDALYDHAHSERSARIVGAWLRARAVDEALTRDVETLVRAHECGGWPDADLVQAADSLSFLETNVELFVRFVETGRFSLDEVRGKFDHMYERIQVRLARELAWPLFERAKAKLAARAEPSSAARRSAPT